jgi:hypothetical protein
MAAREDFFDRIAAFVDATQEPALQVKPPTEIQHNARARLLRNGLAVVGFALLEDFIKRRTGEALEAISLPSVRFSDLPDAIQKAATLGAISSASFQARLQQNAGRDAIAFLQEIAVDVASTKSSAFRLSTIAFGYGQANLNHDEVRKICAAFGIRAPWDDIREVAKRVGLGGTASYEQVFQSAARMRHTAAHEGAADIASADILAFSKNATAIAIGFDVLLSKCLRLVRERNSEHLSGATRVRASDVAFRFVDNGGDGVWRETNEGHTRAIRRSTDPQTLMADAVSRAKRTRQAVVLRGADLTPRRWFPTDEV